MIGQRFAEFGRIAVRTPQDFLVRHIIITFDTHFKVFQKVEKHFGPERSVGIGPVTFQKHRFHHQHRFIGRSNQQARHIIAQQWLVGIFEIGGKNKQQKQIKKDGKSFVVKDDIEFGYRNEIPLWALCLNY